LGKKRTSSGNSYYRGCNITLRRKPADVLMVRYVQEKWKNFNLEGKQMIATFKKAGFIRLIEKSVNAALGSAMVVKKLLLSIAQATR